MKRSKMLEIILTAGETEDHDGWIEGEWPSAISRKVVGEILDAIEAAGMTPPKRKTLKVDSRGFYENGMERSWESE